MSRYWSSRVRDLLPYVPGEQPRIPGLIKLNTNESPFGPSPAVLNAIAATASEDLRLYPDPQSSELCAVIAEYHGVKPNQVFVGNGSDEVLAHAFAALLHQERPLLFPDITYSFYDVFCRLFGIKFETVPLDQDFCVNVSDYETRGGAIIIANPNAPTGIASKRADIEGLVRKRRDIPVVIDEAYVDFGGETAVRLVATCPNLLIVRTMSKSRALAGLRVGYAIGDVGLINALNRVKNSFNSYPLGRPAQAGAIASLQDEVSFQQALATIIDSRTTLTSGLISLGFEVLPSQANFVFARHADYSGGELAAALRARAVLVRHLRGPRTDAFVRITVGSGPDIKALLAALTDILARPSA